MSGERTTSLAASLYSVPGPLSHLWSLSVISLVLNTYPVCPEIWNLSLLMIFFNDFCHASKILRQTEESRPICGLLFLPGLSVRHKSYDHTAQLFSEPLLVSASLSSLPSLISNSCSPVLFQILALNTTNEKAVIQQVYIMRALEGLFYWVSITFRNIEHSMLSQNSHDFIIWSVSWFMKKKVILWFLKLSPEHTRCIYACS